MRCANCGGKLATSRENYKYEACGLDYVTLGDVEVRRCGECGEHEVVIPAAQDLHRAIARYVAKLPVRLRGQEIRFLRKYLGYSSADAAAALDVKPETMSRWENDKAEMSPMVERLLRLMVYNLEPAEVYPPGELTRERTASRPSPVRLERHRNSDWLAAA